MDIPYLPRYGELQASRAPERSLPRWVGAMVGCWKEEDPELKALPEVAGVSSKTPKLMPVLGREVCPLQVVSCDEEQAACVSPCQ